GPPRSDRGEPGWARGADPGRGRTPRSVEWRLRPLPGLVPALALLGELLHHRSGRLLVDVRVGDVEADRLLDVAEHRRLLDLRGRGGGLGCSLARLHGLRPEPPP